MYQNEHDINNLNRNITEKNTNRRMDRHLEKGVWDGQKAGGMKIIKT